MPPGEEALAGIVWPRPGTGMVRALRPGTEVIMPIVHLTAALQSEISTDLLEGLWRARWMALRRAFPRCLAAALRSDHTHLVRHDDEPERAAWRFRQAVLWSTPARLRSLWRFPTVPVLVRDRNHLYKTVRYVLRNPLAEAGVTDPVQWRWSTMRDVVGASVDPWCPAEFLARAMGRSPGPFARWCHPWAAAGADGDPAEVRPLVAAPPRAVPAVGLGAILAAAMEATRCSPRDLLRKRLPRWLFVALARHQGWRDPAALAGVIGVRPGSVRRIGRGLPPAAVGAAALCLGDDRLRASLPTTQLGPDVHRGLLDRRRGAAATLDAGV